MLEKTSNSDGNQISVVIFEVAWEQFTINLLDVKEIIKAGQIRRLPKGLDFIEGIYNYRGDIIHIINLRKKLNLNDYILYKSTKTEASPDETIESNKKYIIIVNIRGSNVGFYIDRIINISHINAKDLIGLSPVFQTSIGIEYIKNIIKFADRPRILIDIDKILSEKEQVSIQQTLSSII